MKNLSVLILVITYALVSVTNVKAMTRPPIQGSKVNTHIPAPKPKQSCHNWKENGWIVELEYYLDNDGTPADVAYGDYLSDLRWYFGQYPGTCKVSSEPKP